METETKTYWILRRKAGGYYTRLSDNYFDAHPLAATRYESAEEAKEDAETVPRKQFTRRVGYRREKELFGAVEVLRMRVRWELEKVEEQT
jgi:hypothetical protein